MNFNSNFYQSNSSFTKEMADAKMIASGYASFQFTGSSYSNGASFYYELENGKKVRVSDHPLTGKREIDMIQISLVQIKKMGINKK